MKCLKVIIDALSFELGLFAISILDDYLKFLYKEIFNVVGYNGTHKGRNERYYYVMITDFFINVR